MGIIIGKTEIVIKRTITKIKIDEGYFEKVLSNNDIYSTIDWSNGSPKLKYNGKDVKVYQCDWMSTFGKQKEYKEYEISKMIKADANKSGIDLLGRLSIDIETTIDEDECTSAHIVGIYFITEIPERVVIQN